LLAAAATYKLEIFTARTGLHSTDRITIHKMPVPFKPVFLESILFTFESILFNLFYPSKALNIGTQGGFPFCDISYAHCCHKLFITRYRENIGGGLLTRTARLINQHWGAAMEAIAFKRARLIVVPSQGLANELVAAYGPAIRRKLHLLPNPVNCNEFLREESSHKHPFTFSFCALGNFEWKGLPLILEAMASGVPGNLQVIGGSPGDIERYRGRAPNVTFVGMQTDIKPYLWASDAFVFPSVYETFPLVCLQAAAAGLALIATDLYGLEQLLQPGHSGWRVERTVNSIAAAMRTAVANPQQTWEMGRNARTLAQKYDEPAFQQRWLDLLSKLTNA
jgi:glycosyltransferase involved in cell wall biosynthesis